MGVDDAIKEVLKVVEEVENIDDLLCGLNAPNTKTALERLNLPEGCSAVLVPTKLFTGPKHLRLAAYLTEVALSEGSAIARKKEIEFMLTYIATRQIREALEAFKPKDSDAVLYVWCASGRATASGIAECLPPPHPDPEAELEAIEKTALFWAEQHR